MGCEILTYAWAVLSVVNLILISYTFYRVRGTRKRIDEANRLLKERNDHAYRD